MTSVSSRLVNVVSTSTHYDEISIPEALRSATASLATDAESKDLELVSYFTVFVGTNCETDLRRGYNV